MGWWVGWRILDLYAANGVVQNTIGQYCRIRCRSGHPLVYNHRGNYLNKIHVQHGWPAHNVQRTNRAHAKGRMVTVVIQCLH